ncbi:ATP-binding protein, partial [Alkaliflexus imshenetskii]|uniref:ATP-binding protein n=1 Tax=Alkaliflexus imshenetskii TaxID=286730 RepID=UPI001C54DAF8
QRYGKLAFTARQNNQLDTLTADEYLALLTDHEWEERQNKKINRLIKHAGFRQNATLADIDYSATRTLDKTCSNGWPRLILSRETKTL